MRRAAAVALALGALAACGGGGGDAGDVLQQTAAKLGTIRSGDLTMKLVVDPVGEGAPFGFELAGPFALGRRGSLPVARLRYTQTANGNRGSATLISTGRQAFVSLNGSVYTLPPADVAQLRSAAGELRASGGLAQLDVGRWIEKPSLHDGGEIGGDATDRVKGKLDVGTVAADLTSLARGFGGGAVPQLGPREIRELREATRQASIDVWSGKDDHLLRRVLLHAALGLDVPSVLESGLGQVVGADVTFELGIAHPNRRVRVAEPRNPLPASALPSS